MFKFYRMRYQNPKIEEFNCSLIDLFEDANNEFVRGSSCCQIIIDEENCVIYSLNEEAYLSADFEYTLQDSSYKVYNCKYFHDINNIELISEDFRGN